MKSESMTKIQLLQQWVMKLVRILSTLIFTSVILLSAKVAFATGVQTFSMDLPNAGPYDPASLVIVRYRYSCSSLTTGCGSLNITTTVPTGLNYVSSAVPTGMNASYDAGTKTISFSRNPYADGNSGDVLVNFRIDPNTGGQTLVVPAISVISDPVDSANNGTLNASVNLTVSNTSPIPQYTVIKTKISPNGTPATGTDVTYRVDLMANTINGNVDVAPLALTDTFPTGATVVDSAGGAVSGNTITWTFPSTDLTQSWINAGSPGGNTPFMITTKTVVLAYPPGSFGSSDVTNEACADGSSSYGNLHTCGSATHGFSTPAPTMTFQKFFPSYDVPTPSEGTSNYFWRLRFHTFDSNVPIKNAVVTENVPAGLQFSKVYSGRWRPSSSLQARLEYSIDNGSAWIILGTQDGSASGAREFVAGVDYPATGVTNFRWTFLGDMPIATETFHDNCFDCENQQGPGFYLTLPAGSAGTTLQNCANVNFTGLASAQQSCHDLTIPASVPRVGASKILATSGSLKPGDEVAFNVYAGNAAGTAPFPDPVLSDLLPPELEFVRWELFSSSDAAAPSPNFEVLPNYNGTGRTLLRWVYGNSVPAGSYRADGTPGVANSYAMPPNQGVYGGFYIKYIARIKAGTPVGTYDNRLHVGSRTYTAPLECAMYQGSITESEADTHDLDGDGNATETQCKSYGERFAVVAAAVMGAEKWIKGNAALPNKDDPNSTPAIPDSFCPALDGSYTRFPCIARTVPGGVFEYKVKLINYGNQALKNYVAYDVFPFVGDTGVSEILTSQTRDTQWSPLLMSAPTAADAYTASVLALPGAELAYTLSSNPCRPELSNSGTESGWQVGCTDDWTTTVTDWSKVKGFRLKVPFTAAPHWEAGKAIILNVPMQVPVNAPFEAVAWNSIAHRSTNAGNDPSVTTTRLDTAEPRKVGIAIPAGSEVPGYRLGNLVWLDSNKDGQADASETGISGVLVEVYKVSGATETLAGSTNTDGNGKYLFTALEAGDYRVKIPTDQTTALNPTALSGKSSVTTGEEADPNTDGDNNDNGTVVEVSGVKSGLVILGEGTGLAEPTHETLRKGDATDDDNDAFADNRSNLTVDFGFAEAVTPPPAKTDLKLTKTASKPTVRHGDTLTYTITLSNESDVAATGVLVEDKLPTGLTFVKATPSQGSFANGVWTVGTVAAHATLIMTLDVKVD